MNRFKVLFLLMFHFSIDSLAQQMEKDSLDCPRSVPSPVLAERKCKTWSFQYNTSKKEGIEKAKLFNGDSVVIIHKGCKFYELGFQYFFQYPQLKENALRDWSAKLIEGLEQLRYSGLESINLKKYQEKLTQEIDKDGFLKDNNAYNAEDFVVKEKIFIENRGRSNKLQYYQFSIAIGPL